MLGSRAGLSYIPFAMSLRTAAVFFLLLAIGPAGVSAAEDPSIPTLLAATDDAALRAAKGQTVVVRGKVTRTGKSKATGVNFINFGAGDFTVVTFGKNLKAFPEGEPADLYKDKFIEVRGEVSLYQDKPQIELASPAQIRIVDEKAVAEASEKEGPAEKAEHKDPEPAATDTATGVDPRKYFTD